MRNLLLTAAAVLLLTAPVRGQEVDDKKRMGLKGPVKTIRTERAELTLTDGKWVEGPRRPGSLVTLDADGRRTEEVHFNDDGTPRDRTVYTYVGTAAWTQTRHRPDGEMTERVDYAEHFDAASRTGRLIIDGMNGLLRAEMIKKYDAEGRVVEALGYDRDNKLRSRSVNRFNEAGALEEFLFYNDDKLQQRHVRTAEGMEVSVYNADGSLRSKELRRKPDEMHPDAHGNWTRQASSRTVSESGRVVEVRQITYRTITYY